MHDKYFDYFSTLADAPEGVEDFASAFSRGSAFPAAMHLALLRLEDVTCVNFCFESIPEMSELTPWDRMTLIGANAGAIFGLELTWFLSPVNLPFYVKLENISFFTFLKILIYLLNLCVFFAGTFSTTAGNTKLEIQCWTCFWLAACLGR